MALDDSALLNSIAEGSRGAMRAFYDRHATRIFRFALARLGDRQVAEDVVQETMLAVWRGAGGFRGESRVDTWLFGIAHNKIREQARKRRVPRTAAGESSEPGPTGVSAPDTSAAEFWEGFAELTGEQRELLLLVFHYGFNYEEVARMLGIPVGTVKSRVHYARKRLGQAMGRDSRWPRGVAARR